MLRDPRGWFLERALQRQYICRMDKRSISAVLSEGDRSDADTPKAAAEHPWRDNQQQQNQQHHQQQHHRPSIRFNTASSPPHIAPQQWPKSSEDADKQLQQAGGAEYLHRAPPPPRPPPPLPPWATLFRRPPAGSAQVLMQLRPGELPPGYAFLVVSSLWMADIMMSAMLCWVQPATQTPEAMRSRAWPESSMTLSSSGPTWQLQWQPSRYSTA